MAGLLRSLKRRTRVLEHNGNLDTYDDYSISYTNPIYTVFGPMAGIRITCHGGPEQADLTYTQALSLLAWLRQEESNLEGLAKEQAREKTDT